MTGQDLRVTYEATALSALVVSACHSECGQMWRGIPAVLWHSDSPESQTRLPVSLQWDRGQKERGVRNKTPR